MKQSVEHTLFLKKAEKIAFDKEHRATIKFNMGKYDAAVQKGKAIYKNIDLARERAGNIKYKVVNELEKYLIQFEHNFLRNGGKIIWAQTEFEAISEIQKLLKKKFVKKVVKSKSMITEEIELNRELERKKIEVVETDLGEFIVQQAGQKPYHIVTPAMHLSKEDIAALYHEKFDTPEDLNPTELTDYTRQLLREKFVHAEAGITGANFLIADTGSIAVTENEGNGLMSMSFPKLHIVIAGIEKIIPKLEDLDLYWPLLATHGTGQTLTAYSNIISGPRKKNEKDGPKEMYLVLLDNGRTNLLSKERQRQALSCIRCGACLNACPVYRNIGGHTYGTTYSGPIGAVITPHLKDFGKYKHLSFASSLCGACTETCPVKIPLHELLLVNRKEAIENGFYTYFEKKSLDMATFALSSRKRLDMISGGKKNFAMKLTVKKIWGPRRELPVIAKKSFSQLWKEREE
jgi:L-lactate dehydrogenase complex protein LldF